MKKLFLLLFVCGAISGAISQSTDNNGQLDNLEELSTKYTIPITMPDGINLMMDIYLPVLRDSLIINVDILGQSVPIQVLRKGVQFIMYDSINGQPNPNPYQLPMIYSRTPYNKGEWDGIAAPMNMLGYAYGVQDMRGRYTSEGVYMPIYSDSWNKNAYHPQYGHVLDVTDLSDPRNGNKHEDGYNTLQRLIDLDWQFDNDQNGVPETTAKLTNGRFGTFGASALGYNQYQLAAARKIDPSAPGLKCMVPIVATQEFFRSTGFQNGVFNDNLVNGWLKGQIFTGTDDDLNDIDNDIDNNLHSATDYGLPNKFVAATNAIEHFSSVRYLGGPAGYYPNSIGRKDMDASRAPVNALGFGDSLGTFSRYTNMEVPAYHLTGWWDIFIDGQIETWNLMRQHLDPNKKNKYLQKLIIGPWAHQTIGSTTTGDMTYKNSVYDILGIDLDAFSETDLPIAQAINSELIQWYRYNLNYDSTQYIGEPKAFIKASDTWSPLFGSIEVKVPAEDYKIPLNELLSFLTGADTLKGIKVAIRTGPNDPGTVSSQDIPPTGTPLVAGLDSAEVLQVEYRDFTDVDNVRMYVVGPVDDGTTVNENVGNYWLGASEFPLQQGVTPTNFYLHKNGSLNVIAPTNDEGTLMYVHDPDDPVISIGGANMIVRTPDGLRDSQGQFDLTEWSEYTLDRPGVLQFETEKLTDTLSIAGFPEVTLYAKTNPAGVTEGPTDTDFHIRIVDVYPDGRELFVVEGCVNARGRHYARSVAMDQEDDNAIFDNINIGEIYEYVFKTLPIAYTFGREHKMKILVSSSNYPKYQANPNLPIMPNEFFRRRPGDGQSYVFEGEEMFPRVAIQRVAFAPEYATRIKLPVLNEDILGMEESNTSSLISNEVLVYPNPTQSNFTVSLSKSSDYNFALIDMLGNVLQERDFIGDTFVADTDRLSAGTYLIQLTDKFTNSRKVVKVVKN
ncbi:MAG: CocE/NonD family hydrolase [Bacteroidota bacterium]|jgi:predicted acyl esterase